jgi:hypothetical protein
MKKHIIMVVILSLTYLWLFVEGMKETLKSDSLYNDFYLIFTNYICVSFEFRSCRYEIHLLVSR